MTRASHQGGRGLPVWSADRAAEPVFDPVVGEAERRELLRHPEALTAVRSGTPLWRLPQDSEAGDYAKAIVVLTGLTGCLSLLGVIGLVGAQKAASFIAIVPRLVGWFAFCAAGILLTGTLMLIWLLIGRHRAHAQQLRAVELAADLREHYILVADDLDEHSRALLRRARTACATITRSDAYAHGVIDQGSHNAVLPQLIWDLARELAELTRQHAAVAEVRHAGPITRAVLAPRASAFEAAEAALEERVAAMESYAERITRMDATCRDLDTARLLAAEDPTLDLASARERDALIAEEIAALTGPVTLHQGQLDLDVEQLVDEARQLDELAAAARFDGLPSLARSSSRRRAHSRFSATIPQARKQARHDPADSAAGRLKGA
ncbi:MAG TPA: hypothetical protein VGM10_30600 [Actinocrinis sp.]|jgi:hypothetical protein